MEVLTYLARHEPKSGLRRDFPRHRHQAVLMPESLGPPHRRLAASILVGDHRPKLYEGAYDGRSTTPRGFYECRFPRSGFVVYVGLPPFHEGSNSFHVTSETFFFNCTACAEERRELVDKLLYVLL